MAAKKTPAKKKAPAKKTPAKKPVKDSEARELVGFGVDPKVKKALETKAAKDGKSVSAYMRELLLRHLKM